jgi:hypothetical protein
MDKRENVYMVAIVGVAFAIWYFMIRSASAAGTVINSASNGPITINGGGGTDPGMLASILATLKSGASGKPQDPGKGAGGGLGGGGGGLGGLGGGGGGGGSSGSWLDNLWGTGANGEGVQQGSTIEQSDPNAEPQHNYTTISDEDAGSYDFSSDDGSSSDTSEQQGSDLSGWNSDGDTSGDASTGDAGSFSTEDF